MEDVIKVCLVNRKDRESYERIEDINLENLVRNGGTLRFEGILYHDYAVVAKIKDRIVGYTLLAKNFFLDDDIYVMQIAVDNKFKGVGVGSAMYDYVEKHSKGFKHFTANVNKNNIASKCFHEKFGFSPFGEEGNTQYSYSKKVNAKKDFSDKEVYFYPIKKKEHESELSK